MANNGNSNWTFQVAVPLANYKPIDPTQTRLPTGAYMGQITGSVMNEAKEPGKPPSIAFTVKVLEQGEFQGREVTLYMGTDQQKDGVLKAWSGLCESVGYPAPTGPANFQAQMFLGKQCYFYVKEAPEGEKTQDGRNKLDDRNFITPGMYQKIKAEALANAHKGGAASGVPANFTPGLGAGLPTGAPTGLPGGLPGGAPMQAPAQAPAMGMPGGFPAPGASPFPAPGQGAASGLASALGTPGAAPGQMPFPGQQ